MIFITLSEDDQILDNVDTEDEEDCKQKHMENCDKSITVLKQCEKTQNVLLLKGKQTIIRFCELSKNIIHRPLL
jgi:hypothetical protein